MFVERDTLICITKEERNVPQLTKIVWEMLLVKGNIEMSRITRI